MKMNGLRSYGVVMVIACVAGVYGMTSGCTTEPPPAFEESSAAASSTLEPESAAVAPPTTAVCPPCPLLHDKRAAEAPALGEPTSNLCSCASCGNDICDNGETHQTCASDCPSSPPPPPPTHVCGNGVCESGETATSCPRDCAPATCGNGRCETGERTTCPEDCCQFNTPPCPV